MKWVYQCADCEGEYSLEDLKVIRGVEVLFLQCPDQECQGDLFNILIK